MFYKFQNTFFVLSHYLLKSFKFNIQQNQFIDLTIGSPTIFVNLYNLIPKLTIKALLLRNYDGMESPTVTIIDEISLLDKNMNENFFSIFIVYSYYYDRDEK